MAIKQQTFNRFNGGRAYDKTSVLGNQFAKSINFDIYTSPSQLIPVRSYEADETYNGSSTGIRTSDLSCFGRFGTSSVYAIGRKSDGTGRKIYSKTLNGSSWTDATASDGSAAESASGCAVPGFFIHQSTSNGSSLYWFVTGHASSRASSFWQIGLLDFSQSAAANFSKKTIAFNPTIYPQAILGKDGVVYVSDGNKLHGCNNDGSIEDSVFTVSRTYTITNLFLADDYLGIAIYGNGISKVLLWDYNQAQASETIEWGEGALMVAENLSGQIVGVTDKFVSSTLFNAGANGTGTMEVKVLGQDPVTFVQAYDSVERPIEQFKYVKNNILHWYAKIPLADGTYEEGIWTFGRRTTDQPYALSLNREIAGSSFEGFWGISDFLYLPHSGDGHVSRTSATDTRTLTSSEESLVVGAENPTVEKRAMGLTQAFAPIESGQTVTLKYRKDGATSWTTIDPVPAIATGDVRAVYPFDEYFHELEIRRESVGAKLSELKFTYEELTNALE